MARVVVDSKAINELASDIKRAKRQLIGRLAERGYQILRDEVPVVTGNLKQGVSTPDVNYEKLEARLAVTARSAAIGPREAKVIGADGKEKKSISLRPVKAFNYAESVARGRPAIGPKSGKALIIPVASAPSGQSYLISGGQIFVVRRSAKATKPNPFDERAAKRLEGESDKIADAILRKLFK